MNQDLHLEFIGRINQVGEVYVYGLSRHEVDNNITNTVYLSIAGAPSSVGSVAAALMENMTLSLTTPDNRTYNIRHSGIPSTEEDESSDPMKRKKRRRRKKGDTDENDPSFGHEYAYRSFTRRIESLAIDHVILVDKRFETPDYTSGKGITYLFDGPALSSKLGYHVRECVNIAIFESWYSHLLNLGVAHGLIQPLLSLGHQVYKVDLNRDRWEDIISQAIKRHQLPWPTDPIVEQDTDPALLTEQATSRRQTSAGYRPTLPMLPAEAAPQQWISRAPKSVADASPVETEQTLEADNYTLSHRGSHTYLTLKQSPPLTTLKDIQKAGWVQEDDTTFFRRQRLTLELAKPQMDKLVRLRPTITPTPGIGSLSAIGTRQPYPITPSQPAPTTAGPATTSVPLPAMEVKHEGTWTWVKFKGIPNEEIRQRLKLLGFRWNSKPHRKAWYLTRTIDEISLRRILSGQPSETTTPDPPSQATDGYGPLRRVYHYQYNDGNTCLTFPATHPLPDLVRARMAARQWSFEPRLNRFVYHSYRSSDDATEDLTNSWYNRSTNPGVPTHIVKTDRTLTTVSFTYKITDRFIELMRKHGWTYHAPLNRFQILRSLTEDDVRAQVKSLWEHSFETTTPVPVTGEAPIPTIRLNPVGPNLGTIISFYDDTSRLPSTFYLIQADGWKLIDAVCGVFHHTVLFGLEDIYRIIRTYWHHVDAPSDLPPLPDDPHRLPLYAISEQGSTTYLHFEPRHLPQRFIALMLDSGWTYHPETGSLTYPDRLHDFKVRELVEFRWHAKGTDYITPNDDLDRAYVLLRKPGGIRIQFAGTVPAPIYTGLTKRGFFGKPDQTYLRGPHDLTYEAFDQIIFDISQVLATDPLRLAPTFHLEQTSDSVILYNLEKLQYHLAFTQLLESSGASVEHNGYQVIWPLVGGSPQANENRLASLSIPEIQTLWMQSLNLDDRLLTTNTPTHPGQPPDGMRRFTMSRRADILQLIFDEPVSLREHYALNQAGWRGKPRSRTYISSSPATLDQIDDLLELAILKAPADFLPPLRFDRFPDYTVLQFPLQLALDSQFVELMKPATFFEHSNVFRWDHPRDGEPHSIPPSTEEIADLWAKSFDITEDDTPDIIAAFHLDESTFVRSRQQDIDDGYLIDASRGELGDVAREIGYKWPIAITHSVWEIIQAAINHPQARNDLQGVWWDILWMSRNRTAHHPDENTVIFQVVITGVRDRPLDDHRFNPDDHLFTLKLISGPGDTKEPVLTLMLPDES